MLLPEKLQSVFENQKTHVISRNAVLQRLEISVGNFYSIAEKG